MLNGASVSTAIAALALIDAELLVESADIALALTMEAARAQLEAFDARIHEARPHRGQVETAANVRRLLEGTRRCSTAAREIVIPGAEAIQSHDVPRLQDAYSIRCAPQVHGPVRDAIRYARGIVNTEINSAVDNPLIFSKTAESGNFEVLSGDPPVPNKFPRLFTLVSSLLNLDNPRPSFEEKFAIRTALHLMNIAGKPQIHRSIRQAETCKDDLVMKNMFYRFKEIYTAYWPQQSRNLEIRVRSGKLRSLDTHPATEIFR